MNDSDKKEFATQMMLIAEIYDKPVSKEKMKIYFATLKEYSIDQVKHGIQLHMADTEQGQFFPKPANIIKHIEGQLPSVIDRAEIAWLEVENAIRFIGSYGTLKLQDKIAVAAVKSLGSWSDLCSTNIDKMQWKKKEFINAYELLSNTPLEMLPRSLHGIEDIKNAKSESKSQLKSLQDGLKKYRENNNDVRKEINSETKSEI